MRIAHHEPSHLLELAIPRQARHQRRWIKIEEA